ncbi:hypothetical protein ACFYVR_20840 [Rhodococcus sp. NPDC003318]|uniref:TY-Chap domain-containing protein n=1 Tax=Rhodococcus sp. NPDC003318 TaxID=3364503 RepID=UPI0036A6BCF4
MSDVEKFDHAVELAWRMFRGALADHVGAMRDDDILVVELPDRDDTADGYAPCVQFLGWARGQVRCEVPSNAFLAPRFALSPDAESLLLELGWQPPTCAPDEESADGSPAFFLDRPSRFSDQLAAMAVTVFREIWSVPHPSFLRIDTAGEAPESPVAALTSTPPEVTDLEPMLAVTPRDPDHLRRLVENTLTDVLGELPATDADGDFVLSVEGHSVFVVPHPREPVVRLWVPLLYRIGGRTRAAEIVADLTAQWSHIRFVLREDRLNAVVEIPGFPFVPRHLTDQIDRVSTFLGTVDQAFAARFDAVGHRATAAADHECEPEIPAALLTLVQLVLYARDSLDDDTVAEICDRDRATVLDYLRIAAEQKSEWRDNLTKARDADETDEIDLCESEHSAWSQTHDALRGALRVVTFSRPGDHPAPPAPAPRQATLFDDPDELTLFDEPN